MILCYPGYLPWQFALPVIRVFLYFFISSRKCVLFFFLFIMLVKAKSQEAMLNGCSYLCKVQNEIYLPFSMSKNSTLTDTRFLLIYCHLVNYNFQLWLGGWWCQFTQQIKEREQVETCGDWDRHWVFVLFSPAHEVLYLHGGDWISFPCLWLLVPGCLVQQCVAGYEAGCVLDQQWFSVVFYWACVFLEMIGFEWQ